MPSELFLSRGAGKVWSVLREDGATVEVRAEREDQPVRVGQVVAARVSNVLPSIQAVFLDVGSGRDAFLHASDLLPAPDPDAPPAPIEDRLHPGDELLVQIVREGAGDKGDRASCFLGFPGRLVILFPCAPQNAVSRRIRDAVERERLLACLSRLDLGQAGILARTAAHGASFGSLQGEAARLIETWNEVRRRARTVRAPAVLLHELPLPLRVLRDGPREGWKRIVVDDPGFGERMRDYLEASASPGTVEIHEGPRPLFEAHGLARDVERAVCRRIWLGSGGYVVIEPTEALVSIDVNTGKSSRGVDQEQTILQTNLEAAIEIGRQLRLRDLGGIIVIDFVDMVSPDAWREVLAAFESALHSDPARTKVVGLSELGLLQLTRKRTRAGLRDVLTSPCPRCSGEGRIRTGT